MRVVVLGAGSLGSLLAGSLAGTSTDATLLGRESDHVERVRRDGLRVTRPDGTAETVQLSVETDESAAADADLLVVCVKSYDTEEAVGGVAPHLDDADVLTLQNGLGNAEAIATYVPRDRVIAGTTTHGATLEAPGHVRHAGRGETTIGRYLAPNDAGVTAAAEAFTAAGIETIVTEDAEAAVWTKVLVNAGINAATALARAPNGVLVDSESGERLLQRAVEEGARVARAEGIAVPEDVVERSREVAERTATNRSSMRQDVERGRRTEIEALNGALVRRGADCGVETPVNETLADLIRLREKRERGGG